jgi:hypothetical protein
MEETYNKVVAMECTISESKYEEGPTQLELTDAILHDLGGEFIKRQAQARA